MNRKGDRVRTLKFRVWRLWQTEFRFSFPFLSEKLHRHIFSEKETERVSKNPLSLFGEEGEEGEREEEKEVGITGEDDGENDERERNGERYTAHRIRDMVQEKSLAKVPSFPLSF